MYIFVTEEGDILQAETISEQDKASCDDGRLSAIKITDDGFAFEYYNGKWNNLDKVWTPQGDNGW